ncbi:gp58-like family protein [Latilactobacillus curvatus]|uniref:gp58-like family protein n=1 Tax=Latilactobacillus curvatus TaxID=28038 RepID=UPI0024B8C8AE|nr:gp58-like family protein [Latilactobacillus curvatus]WHQ78073.1 gp58-like family protein [Latilactobacillus curvatus]
MLKVSDAFNSAFAAPDRELRARVTIGKTVYDSDDLTSINYDSGAMTGEQFSIGSTYMNSTKITFSHLVEGLKQLDEVLVEFGVLKPDGAVEYVKMGTFIVDDKIQMDRNNNTTTIECMDRMTMLGGAYVSKLTYPARIKDVAVEIANMAGVKANETSFARLSENKINQPTGYTYRDAIGLIAQFQMGFALFDRDGLLDIRTLQDNSFKIDPNQYFLKGLVKNETFFKLNGISCTVVTTSKDENGNETSKTTVLQSGSSSGAQIKLANNVMTQDVLDRMYEALKFTNYYPFSLNWNGNPAVEAGDWLTVEDLQGNEFKVPNMSYTLTYNGGLTATSKADTSVSSPATYSYGGTISNIVNEIGGRESAEGNHIYEGTEDQEPTLSKEGDLWYKHVGPDTEEWIYKDGKWEFLTSTKPATDAQKAADAAQKEAEEAKKTANESVAAADDAVGKANQAVEDAGFANSTASDAKTAAANAQKDATGALSDAQKALTNSSSAQADSTQARKDSATAAADAVTALTDAKKALTDSSSAMADSAQARKDSATAKIQAANAATQANQAVTDASTAKADAAAAKGQATNALGQANTAIGNALTALNKVNDMSIGGRNYLLNSNQYLTGAGKNQKHVADISGDTLQKLRGKQVTISVDVDYTNARHEVGEKCRIGIEFAISYESGQRQYLGVWKTTTAGESYSGRISQTMSFKDEPIISTSVEVQVYAQDTFDSSSVGRPKLEIGNVATDWSPAPEDVQQQFTDINGELSQKVSQTTYNTLAGTVDTVSTLAKQNQSTIGTLATKTSVDTVNKTATTAQTLAQQNANELLNKASTKTVDTLTQRVTTTESTLSQTATKAELALTKTDVDKLNDTVKSQGVTLDATATKAELQVAQTNVDNLKKTVTSNTAGMTANANALKLKADSSTVSDLDGRVTSLSGQLDVQSDLISAKVTASDVTGMLGNYATQTWTQSQINITADGINSTLSSVKTTVDGQTTSINDLKADSSSFKSQFTTVNNTLGKQTTDIGTLQATSKELSTGFNTLTTDNTTNKNDISQLKQTATELNSTMMTVKTQVQNSAVGTNLYTDTKNFDNLASWSAFRWWTKTTDTYKGLSVVQTTANWTGLSQYVQVKKGDVLTYSVYAKNTSGTGTSQISWQLDSQAEGSYSTATVNPKFITVTITDSWQRVSGTAVATSDGYLRPRLERTPNNTNTLQIAGIKVEKGSLATDWCPNPADNASVTALSKLSQTVNGIQTTVSGKADKSQITQLAGQITSVVGDVSANSSQITQMKADINLRVKAGDVVNQINISPEGILIDGKKVHITGQTTIDNAVIKDAMIADIKADKITAGTLNAANVNVINLNANNITTGTIKGANLSMNLNTGEVVFQKGAIRSTNGNLNIDISKGTMAVINQYKSGFYFEDGKLVLNDGWLEGTSNQPKYGSLEYNANFFTVNGLAVKGTEGVTIGTPGYNPLAMFTSVNESGIAIDKKHLEIGSVGPTIISSGNRFFMNLLTQSPFIAVGTTADGSYMTTSDPGSRISLYAEYVHIKSAYSKTASGSANVIVSQDGALVRSTSASKYKTDIIRTNIPDYGEKLLNLPTATWTDIAETKRYRDDPVNQIKPTRNFGMIAEDLADAGLEMLVVRGTDGELEGINYDRIGPALIPVIAKLKNEVETLKQQLEEKTA